MLSKDSIEETLIGNLALKELNKRLTETDDLYLDEDDQLFRPNQTIFFNNYPPVNESPADNKDFFIDHYLFKSIENSSGLETIISDKTENP